MKAMKGRKEQDERPLRRQTECDHTGRVWLYSGSVVHTGWTFGIDTTSVVRLFVKTHYKRENPSSDSVTLCRGYQSVSIAFEELFRNEN